MIREMSITDALPLLRKAYTHYSHVSPAKHSDSLAVLEMSIEKAESKYAEDTTVILNEGLMGYLLAMLEFFITVAYTNKEEKVMEITSLASFSDMATVPVLLHAVRVAKREGADAIQGEPMNKKIKAMYAKVGFVQSEPHDELNIMFKYMR